MEVKSGYKQTEVGVIPEEWECPRIRDAAAKSSNATVGGPFGSDLVSADYVESGVPVIRGQNMSFSFVAGDFVFVSEKKARSLSANLAHPKDLVFTQRGTLGQVAIVPDGSFESYLISQSQMKVSLDRSRHDPHFIHQYFTSAAGQKQIVTSAIQTGVPHTNLGILRAYRFPSPPIPEQRAIATALCDVDGLLGGLDRLIAKKRDLKQAAMQQLLTGQTRLPGFHGEWEVKRLGEIAHIKTGSRNNENKVEDGQYPFFVRSEVVERINSYSHDCEAILVPGEGRIGDIFHYINGRFDVHQRVYAITKFVPGISGRFIHFYLAKNFGAWAMQNTVKATVDSLRLPTFQTFEMHLPPTEAEQIAIATVLSEMDGELAVLEQRREKTRALKQAMMQELLTGRTRLV
jgi:type I restriction enzyme, S subunit